MVDDERAFGDQRNRDRTTRAPSRLFTIRLWTEEGATGGTEYRGSVWDVLGGAFRGFRDWADLTDFLAAQIEDAENAQLGRSRGGSGWPLEERR